MATIPEKAAPEKKAEPGQQKRRACDECRGRKLACSKEPDGCARCRQEGIQCHYSAQKPMGRPRKRPRAEIEQETVVQLPAQLPTAAAAAAPVFDSSIGMDLDLSFLDVGEPSFSFLDLLDPAFQNSNEPIAQAIHSVPKESPETTTSGVWHMAGSLGPVINFDPVPAEPPLPGLNAPTDDELSRLLSEVESAEALPSLSPSSSHSAPSQAQNSPASSDTPATCGCMASLYLALDSLQHLPKEVGPAMGVARSASKTAHDTIFCPVCGQPPLEQVHSVQITSFSNMMLLGALLPALSNAYMRILEMVDGEAAKADAERRKIVFSLKEYGGIWGQLAMEDNKCGATDSLDGAMLEPTMWRLTVRALLKVDVYGINDKTSDGANCNIYQPGLKDIIAMMEERSVARHTLLDNMVASGAVPHPPGCEYVPLHSPEKPTCMRIIDIAKRSMNDLVIP